METALLIKALETALRYEDDVLRRVASHRGEAYLPATRDAYAAILEILRRGTPGPAEWDQVYAQLDGVFKLEYFHGVQLEAIAGWVDRWLERQGAVKFSNKKLLDTLRGPNGRRADGQWP